jgi:hypothetical protein
MFAITKNALKFTRNLVAQKMGMRWNGAGGGGGRAKGKKGEGEGGGSCMPNDFSFRCGAPESKPKFLF